MSEYEPKLIYYPERDEFEYVTRDESGIYHDPLPPSGTAIILDMATREPIGFRVDGQMVRDASPPPTTERERALEEALRIYAEWSVDVADLKQLGDLARRLELAGVSEASRALSSPLRPEGEALIAWLDSDPLIDILGKLGRMSRADYEGLKQRGLAALSARPQPPQQPVAWRVKYYGEYASGVFGWSDWMLTQLPEMALRPVSGKLMVEPLYAAPLAQPVATAGGREKLIAELLTTVHRPQPDSKPGYWHVSNGRHVRFGEIMSEISALRPPLTQPKAEEAGNG